MESPTRVPSSTRAGADLELGAAGALRDAPQRPHLFDDAGEHLGHLDVGFQQHVLSDRAPDGVREARRVLQAGHGGQGQQVRRAAPDQAAGSRRWPDDRPDPSARRAAASVGPPSSSTSKRPRCASSRSASARPPSQRSTWMPAPVSRSLELVRHLARQHQRRVAFRAGEEPCVVAEAAPRRS